MNIYLRFAFESLLQRSARAISVYYTTKAYTFIEHSLNVFTSKNAYSFKHLSFIPVVTILLFTITVLFNKYLWVKWNNFVRGGALRCTPLGRYAYVRIDWLVGNVANIPAFALNSDEMVDVSQHSTSVHDPYIQSVHGQIVFVGFHLPLYFREK